jgi:transposase
MVGTFPFGIGPRKVIISAVARKLVTIANALRKNRQKWTAATA